MKIKKCTLRNIFIPKPVNIFSALKKLNDDELVQYLHEEIQMKGRQKEVMEKMDCWPRFTTLQVALELRKSSEVIIKLVEIGGHQLVIAKNRGGYTALHFGYFYYLNPNKEGFVLMIKEGVLAQVGGEFGIGGLFNCAPRGYHVQRNIYQEWDNFAPSLQNAFASLEHQPPILHAAIIANAPWRVIADIIHRFDCLWAKDSLNRHPIDVARQEDFCFDELVQEIDAMAATQQRPVIHLAAQYGLKWRSHMKELIESNAEEVVNGVDDVTGLPLFMLAATDKDYDLTSIYVMMKMNPYTRDV